MAFIARGKRAYARANTLTECEQKLTAFFASDNLHTLGIDSQIVDKNDRVIGSDWKLWDKYGRPECIIHIREQ